MVGDEDTNDPIAYDLCRQEAKIPFVREAFGHNPYERAKKYSQFLIQNSVPTHLRIFHGYGHSLPLETAFSEANAFFDSAKNGENNVPRSDS